MITQCQCLLWNYVPLADGIRSCLYHFNRCIIITTSSSIMLNRARHFLPLVCLQIKLNSLKVTRRVPRTASWLADWLDDCSTNDHGARSEKESCSISILMSRFIFTHFQTLQQLKIKATHLRVQTQYVLLKSGANRHHTRPG